MEFSMCLEFAPEIYLLDFFFFIFISRALLHVDSQLQSWSSLFLVLYEGIFLYKMIKLYFYICTYPRMLLKKTLILFLPKIDWKS